MRQIIRLQNGLKGSSEKSFKNYTRLDESKKTLAYITERIRQISEIWQDFQKTHYEIITADDEDEDNVAMMEEYEKLELYEQFEDTYYEFLSKLNQCLKEKEPIPSETPVRMVQSHKAEVKLPRIDLPRFNGDYKKWSSFHDMFISLIHSDSRIPNVQKLHYLKSCLSDEAERLLKQFDMVEDNYNIAWQTLTDRYNNVKVLVSCHLKELCGQSLIKWESKQAIKNLLDSTKELLHELNTLGVPTTDWDPIVIYMVVQKLPQETVKLWEQEISRQSELPKLQQLYTFLESRFRMLEAISGTNIQPAPYSIARRIKSHHVNSIGTNSNTNQKASENRSIANKNLSYVGNSFSKKKFWSKNENQHNTSEHEVQELCVLCNQRHQLYQCAQYNALPISQRRKVVLQHKRCFHCLAKYKRENCRSNRMCYKCGDRHHTSLHEDVPKDNQTTMRNMKDDLSQKATVECHHNNNSIHTLLATAIVNVKGANGNMIPLRALIDSGSQSSFITESAFQAIRAESRSAHLQIAGLGSARLTTAKEEAAFTIISRLSKFELPIKAFVIKRVTSITPPQYIEITSMRHLCNLKLSDPEFNEPGRIDLLLGVNVYSKILLNGMLLGKNGLPTAQNTELGWVLFGEIPTKSFTRRNDNFNVTVSEVSCCNELNNQIKKFWEIEELPVKRASNEDKDCEEYYKRTTKRLPTGEYQVRLPSTITI